MILRGDQCEPGMLVKWVRWQAGYGKVHRYGTVVVYDFFCDDDPVLCVDWGDDVHDALDQNARVKVVYR